MTRRRGIWPFVSVVARDAGLTRCVIALASVSAGLPGCHSPSSPAAPAKSASPSKVSGAVKEADLATVTLTSEAEKRLGIALAEWDRFAADQVWQYGSVFDCLLRLLTTTPGRKNVERALRLVAVARSGGNSAHRRNAPGACP